MADSSRYESEHSVHSRSPHGGSDNSDTLLIWILVFLAALVPNVVYLVFCTNFTKWGTWLVVHVASKSHSVYGDAILCGAALLAVMSYVFDWTKWPWFLKILIGAIIWILFVTGSVLKERKYPSGLRVSILLHTPLLLALVRLRWDKHNRHESRQKFYDTVGIVCLVFAALWLLAFMLYVLPVPGLPIYSDSHYWEDAKHSMSERISEVYEFVLDGRPLIAEDCSSQDPSDVTINGTRHISGELRLKVLAACKQADTIMVFLWVSPMVAFGGFLVLCGVCLFVMSGVNALRDDTRATVEAAAPLVMSITLCVGGMYVSSSLTGVTLNLSNGLIAMCFWGFSATAIWTPFELSTGELENLTELLKANMNSDSKVREIMDNEWVQAMLTGSGLMPGLITLETLRRWCSCMCCGQSSTDANSIAPPDEQQSLVSEDSPPDSPRGFDGVMEKFKQYYIYWNWASVLMKVCILGDLYFTLQVGGTKASYVFLAGMNEYLLGQAYFFSLVTVFIIGLIMFLLPPVPGVPVYVFCGIVLGREREDSPLGFRGACFVAVAMGLVLKLIACCCQYTLGFCAGRDVRIKKFVGVDTTNVKAIESILKGNDILKKIVIFVGGPDWPTSVMSGILKVNLPGMVLLTVPVVLVMAPCVLAGAYMSKVKPTTQNADSMLADGLMAMAAFGQLGSMVLATFYITKAVTDGDEDVTRERNDHKDVKALRDAEKQYNTLYEQKLLDIYEAQDGRWWLIVGATALNVLSNLAFTSDLAFENFAVSGKISDGLDEFGLGGNAFNIVRPVGWCALSVFIGSIILHVAFTCSVSQEVQSSVSQDAQNE